MKPGDTLWSISKTYGVSVKELREINKIKGDIILVGQKIKIQDKKDNVIKHEVKKGETIWSISRMYSVTVKEVKESNGLKDDKIKVGQKIIIPRQVSIKEEGKESALTEYIVKRGDTLWSISQKVGISVQEIIEINKLKSEIITIGQKIKLKKQNIEIKSQKETTHNLNLRSKPNTNSKILITIPKGEILSVKKNKNKWYEVTYKGFEGFVHGDYLKDIDRETSTQEQYARVNVSAVYLRSGPGTNNEALGLLFNGDRVKLLSTRINEWWEVEARGEKGYVYSEYLTKILNENVTGSFKVVLDPGHGGFDPGAVNGFTKESDINFNVSSFLKEELEIRGHNVLLTRSGMNQTCSGVNQTSVELNCRVELTNKINPDLFVSIHTNSGPMLARGIETYYSQNAFNVLESKRAAEIIHKHYKNAIETNDRGIKAENFKVLREVKAPSVLLEIGFLSNPNELKKLINPTVQKEYARRIADGIEEFLKK